MEFITVSETDRKRVAVLLNLLGRAVLELKGVEVIAAGQVYTWATDLADRLSKKIITKEMLKPLVLMDAQAEAMEPSPPGAPDPCDVAKAEAESVAPPPSEPVPSEAKPAA